jgi:hypothetical protein
MYIPIFQISDSYIVKNKLDYNSTNNGELSSEPYRILFTDYDLARKVQSRNSENYNSVLLTEDLSSITELKLNHIKSEYTIRLSDNVIFNNISNETNIIYNDNDDNYEYVVDDISKYNIGDNIEISYYTNEIKQINITYRHNGNVGEMWYISGSTINNKYVDVVDKSTVYMTSNDKYVTQYEYSGTTTQNNQLLSLNRIKYHDTPIIRLKTTVIGKDGNKITVINNLEKYIYKNLIIPYYSINYQIINLNTSSKDYPSLCDKIKKSPFGDNFKCRLKNINQELEIIPIKNIKNIYFDYNVFEIELGTNIYNFSTECLYNNYNLKDFLSQFGYSGNISIYNDFNANIVPFTYNGIDQQIELKLDNVDDLENFKNHTFINIHTSNGDYKCLLINKNEDSVIILTPLNLDSNTVISSISNLHTIQDISDMLNECYYNVSDN